MANPIGNRLSRLVREHAYLSGSLVGLKEEVRLAEANLAAKVGRLSLALQRLTDVAQSIAELSAIDLSGIAAIRATPRVGKREHGDLRCAIVDIMKHGKPVNTAEMVQCLAPMFGWDLSTRKGREHAMHAVKRPLIVFRQKGLVERLPDHLSKNGIKCGVWRWIGPSDTNEAATQKKTADQ